MTKLKQLIDKAGLTQSEVAHACGISEDTITRLVNSNEAVMKTSYGTIINLCNTLGCIPQDFSNEYYEYSRYEEEGYMPQFTIRLELPEFTANEKLYICDILNDSIYTPGVHPVDFLRLSIMDGDKVNNLGKKWELDAWHLSQKIAKLTSYQAWVIICKAHEWINAGSGDTSKIW
jgi:transcriptional regulator with XRE-family HTH domain